MFKVAVLISGAGTTLKSIIDDSKTDSTYEIALVISDRNCKGIEYAKAENIPFIILERDSTLSDRILAQVDSFDLVVLAGFLSILEGEILVAMKNKIINLHPSLLPSFGGKGMYGIHVHEAVLKSETPISGCTVHFVDEVVDGGNFILKRIIGIKEAKNANEIQSLVSSIEKGALTDAIRLIAKGEENYESTY